MKIIRIVNNEPMEFELTLQELYNAHAEHVTNFMRDTLINDFDLDLDAANDVAERAYEIYCCGDGQTEYECIEEAYNEYRIEYEGMQKGD